MDDPSKYTREWFSWANAVFCELVLDYCQIRGEKIAGKGGKRCRAWEHFIYCLKGEFLQSESAFAIRWFRMGR